MSSMFGSVGGWFSATADGEDKPYVRAIDDARDGVC